jgi:hypothetical protein
MTDTGTFKVGGSALNDYLPANQLLYFDQFNEINQSAYQQDAKSQLKNNNLHKNFDRNQSILGALVMNDFKNTRNVKPLISDIYLNSKRNFKKIRLASIDYTENERSNMKSFLHSNKSSIVRLGPDARQNMNRTMLNFNDSQDAKLPENPLVGKVSPTSNKSRANGVFLKRGMTL